jgi:hypothetical protein
LKDKLVETGYNNLFKAQFACSANKGATTVFFRIKVEVQTSLFAQFA